LQGVACATPGYPTEPTKMFLKRFLYLLISVLCQKLPFLFNSHFCCIGILVIYILIF
jgi:hypothetical protein